MKQKKNENASINKNYKKRLSARQTLIYLLNKKNCAKRSLKRSARLRNMLERRLN